MNNTTSVVNSSCSHCCQLGNWFFSIEKFFHFYSPLGFIFTDKQKQDFGEANTILIELVKSLNDHRSPYVCPVKGRSWQPWLRQQPFVEGNFTQQIKFST